MIKKLIIIPAYNEADKIGIFTDELKKTIDDSYDILVVNDGSTDNTANILENILGIKYVNLIFNLGIGGAVQTGYKYADKFGYDIAIQMDGDGQHSPESLIPLVNYLVANNADMVIGSRFIKYEGFQSTFLRRMGISFFQKLIKFLSNVEITDPTSGFRACNRSLIRLFASDYPHDYPEPETNAYVAKKGYVILELPVKMRARDTGASSII